MKLILPKEHGAWAMWIAPFIIGIGVTNFHWYHLQLFVSIFFVYIAISPFLQGFRRPIERKTAWKLALTYLGIALLFGIPIIYYFPKILYIPIFVAPLFIITIYFVITKNERALFNDFIGIAALNSTLFASYYISTQQYDLKSMFLWILQIALFFGSALYVKMLFRERESKNFKWIAKIYMILLPVIVFLFFGPFVMIAFLFSTFRSLMTPVGTVLTPKKVGMIEIANTSWFIVWTIIAFS